MSKQKKSHGVPGLIHARPGEGVAIDVVAGNLSALGGPGPTEVGVDLSKARVPDRRYGADVCALFRARNEFKLMFGQERVDNGGWRTLLIVKMSKVSGAQFAHTAANMKNPTLAEIVVALDDRPEPLVTSPMEPAFANQAVSLVANLGLVGVSGHEACIDFYHASPFAMGAVRFSNKLVVDPVVRIDLRTSLLLSLINEILYLVPHDVGLGA